MKTIGELISEHRFFKDLNDKELEIITGCGKNVHYKKGDTIFREGDPAEFFFLIRKGRVSLEIDGAQRGAIRIQTVEDGGILGWSWLIPPHFWKFSGVAVDETSLIALDGKCLRGKCQKDHDLGYKLLLRFSGDLSHRLEETRIQLLDVYGEHSCS